jgi:hypothetical protein
MANANQLRAATSYAWTYRSLSTITSIHCVDLVPLSFSVGPLIGIT